MIAISEAEFNTLVDYIKRYYGIDLTKKKVLIEGRLSKALKEQGFSSYTAYLDYIFSNPTSDEAKKMISYLTTNHTYFMREPAHFQYFKEAVLPYYDKTLKDRDLRIWSAGCSTGEEPYTLAMIIHDYFGYRKPDWDTRILATDISVHALSKAREGVYRAEELKNVPNIWKLNYFNKIDEDRFEISKKIKDDVIFRGFNLMNDVFPFKRKFHVIFCRNVMIYFDLETKEKLVQKLYKHTEPGGYLFVGHSESLNRNDNCYQYVMPSVYRKG